MALRKKQENTTAALRAARRRLTASVLTTLLSLALVSAAVFEGVSFGWLALPTREVNSGGEAMTSQGVGTENGHDVFMYSEAERAGVCIMGQTVTMNTYDKVFPLRNGKTPIILRAVLSPANAENAAAGLKLNLTCASKSPKRETVNGEAVDWLSNVANVRAAYIPGLESRAVEGKWTPYGQDTSTAPYPYKDADDYIYSYALDFFENATNLESATFFEVEKQDAQIVETTGIVTIPASSASDIAVPTEAESKIENGVTVTTTYEITGHRIWNDSANGYLSIDTNGSIVTATNEEAANWTLIPSGDGYKMRCNGYYLSLASGWPYGLFVANQESSAAVWIFSDVEGGVSLKGTMNGVGKYLCCENKTEWYANSSWESDGYYDPIFTVHKVQKSLTRERYPELEVANKVVSIDVDLNAAKERDNGYYYVYLMIDYDKPLVDKYLTDNELTWTIGSKGDITFKDEFEIEVVKK